MPDLSILVSVHGWRFASMQHNFVCVCRTSFRNVILRWKCERTFRVNFYTCCIYMVYSIQQLTELYSILILILLSNFPFNSPKTSFCFFFYLFVWQEIKLISIEFVFEPFVPIFRSIHRDVLVCVCICKCVFAHKYFIQSYRLQIIHTHKHWNKLRWTVDMIAACQACRQNKFTNFPNPKESKKK